MVVEPKMYCTRGQYDSHYTTNVVYGLMIYLPVFYIFLKKLLHDRNISLRLKNLAEPQHFYCGACTKLGEVSLMYISIRCINFVYVSTIYRLDYRLFLMVWYILFHLYDKYILHKLKTIT
jgi:hypothetical protein